MISRSADPSEAHFMHLSFLGCSHPSVCFMLRSIVIWYIYLYTCSSETSVFARISINVVSMKFHRNSNSSNSMKLFHSRKAIWTTDKYPVGVHLSIHTMERAMPLCCLCPVCAPGISMPRASISMPAAPPWLNGISSICSRGYEMCPIPEEMWRISCHEVEPIQGGNTPNIQTLEHLVNKWQNTSYHQYPALTAK